MIIWLALLVLGDVDGTGTPSAPVSTDTTRRTIAALAMRNAVFTAQRGG